jgi:cell wall-associated NlpC family hydrolase
MKRIGILAVFLGLLLSSCVPNGNIRRSGWMFSESDREGIVRTAKRYIGVRYRHGGETPRGFDCSGYVKYVYNKNNLEISRSAKEQFNDGRNISLSRLRPADLVFFRTGGRGISHVGIYLGRRRFIHAPSSGKRVSIASMDNRYWKRRFAGAVSYFR